MNEQSFGKVTKDGLIGPTKSALDETCSAGGSCGGSGGSVGAGIVPFALGNDSEGEIRISAACNGVIGYKPTINRWLS